MRIRFHTSEERGPEFEVEHEVANAEDAAELCEVIAVLNKKLLGAEGSTPEV